MYAPVAAAEGAELRCADSGALAADSERKRSQQIQMALGDEPRVALTRRRLALAALAVALAVALGVAAYAFTHSPAFDAFVQWLQVRVMVGDSLAGWLCLRRCIRRRTSCSARASTSRASCCSSCCGAHNDTLARRPRAGNCADSPVHVRSFPSSGFELLAGYIFGFWLGLALATAGKLTGSVLSFVIGRYLCRERVREYLDTRAHPAFRAFQTLLERRQVLVVFLTRTAFFPIAIKNYGLSALGVGFPVYFSAALLTGLPFSVVWVYSGQAAQQLTLVLANSQSHATTEIVLLLVGALSAIALLGFVGCYTRKYVLDMAEKENNAAAAAADKPMEVASSASDSAEIAFDTATESV